MIPLRPLLLVPLLALAAPMPAMAAGDYNGYSHFDLQLCYNSISVVALYAPEAEKAPYMIKRDAILNAIQRAAEGFDTADDDKGYAMDQFREWTKQYDAAAVEDRVVMILDAMKRADECAVVDADGNLVTPAKDEDD